MPNQLHSIAPSLSSKQESKAPPTHIQLAANRGKAWIPQ